MLELRNITKEYVTGAETVEALKGVSLAFRQSEFVSVLGPSGCGKTTLLNIMGGLDQYTSGDLIINGVSTKEYKDADWDAYRNNSVGFVFQSYNLIPHQTVLSNVELALTLSGVSPDERRRRAEDALRQVGLGDQMNKKPSQMSGGQMQRVAIARALINNPDILLADEPTGALDSETSVQIMDIIKSIARDRLVVMVTHNPELAKEYSTRIVSLSDGRVTGDSNPFNPAAEAEARSAMRELKGLAAGAAAAQAGNAADGFADDEELINGAGKLKNRSMSLKTAMQLSLNNLMTKKARTLLTAFAGSIGIIGIALILSVSHGFQNYIDQMENDTLTSYPLTIQSETADMTSMATAFMTSVEESEGAAEDSVKEMQIMSGMFASVGSNDLKTFNNYVKEHENAELAGCFDTIQYGYGIQPKIFSTNFDYGVLQICPSTFMSKYMNSLQQTALSYSNMDIFSEVIDNQEMIDEQYKVIAGKWPTEYNEMALVLTSEHTMSDYLAYCLGLKDPDELTDMVNSLMEGKEVTYDEKPLEWTYEELMNLEFSLVPASDMYKYNSSYDVWEDMSDDDDYMKGLINNSEKLHITCIAIPNPDNTASSSAMGVLYLPSLTQHVIDVAEESDIVKMQRAQNKKDVFSGELFEDLNDDEKNTSLGFGDMISIDEKKLASAFGGNFSQDSITKIISKYSVNISDDISADTSAYESKLNSDISTACSAIAQSIVDEYTDKHTHEVVFTPEQAQAAVGTYLSSDAFKAMANELGTMSGLGSDAFIQILQGFIGGYSMVLENLASSGYPLPAAAITGSATAYASDSSITDSVKKTAQGIVEGVSTKDVMTDVGQMTAEVVTEMASAMNVDPNAIASAFTMKMDEEELTRLISSYMSGTADSSYEGNLRLLGFADTSNPYSIAYYLKDFESKEKFMDFIDKYNEDMEANGDDDLVISYTDITGVLLNSVKKITNAVSYVLIAFVAISLIVSSIMIGVITYISVLERTKEIGILRAIGASKKDISRIFNAETGIIGLCAGVIGIAVSLLLLIPINAILIKLTGIAALKAILPAVGAVALILISIVLTLVAGIIPSGMASRKDPVEALRTE